ncbi:MAG: endonuclease/exonuclease/phosphatase family protein [Bradymonadia bacterium]
MQRNVQTDTERRMVRVATFNASLNRAKAGLLLKDLQTDTNQQARTIAETIQRLRPDVLALQEFDYDAEGAGITAFQNNYLNRKQGDERPIHYPFVYAPPVNTGVSSGVDLDGQGGTEGPNDAFGFGRFPGQYGFVILSRFPIDRPLIRTFQMVRWADLRGAKLPTDSDGHPYYSKDATDVFRLSSKNHVDVPIKIHGARIHMLVSHPTPPVFDGPENRNGLRNHDEIKLWTEYINGSSSMSFSDDAGARHGLPPGTPFVLLGDLNADPVDGESVDGAINQLLKHPRVHPAVAVGELVPTSSGGAANGVKYPDHRGRPEHDTAEWGLRVDYVLPSIELVPRASGIFWPASNEPAAHLVAKTIDGKSATDHRLVWVDIEIDVDAQSQHKK